jgi:hypothetical protein
MTGAAVCEGCQVRELDIGLLLEIVEVMEWELALIRALRPTPVNTARTAELRDRCHPSRGPGVGPGGD